MSKTIDVTHLAKLANLPITEKQTLALQTSLSKTLDYVDVIKSLDTNNVSETNQVTNLSNVYREDIIDMTRVFSQEQSLSNATKSHNGFFVVNSVMDF
jgi:aspartyl-tRNA(Asn)/glutamyl-tRNA(Gln) amidotransferase subunit C